MGVFKMTDRRHGGGGAAPTPPTPVDARRQEVRRLAGELAMSEIQ
jgi:hypothetical protein